MKQQIAVLFACAFSSYNTVNGHKTIFEIDWSDKTKKRSVFENVITDIEKLTYGKTIEINNISNANKTNCQ